LLVAAAPRLRFTPFSRKSRSPSQDRHRRYADKKHADFHDKTRNHQRSVGLDRGERVARDLLGRNLNKFRAAFWLAARTFCGFR